MPLRVLIVDDEPLGRRGVRARLVQHGGVEIVGECRNGREAVAAIARASPDLVFLDVQMPGLSGFDVIRQVGAERMPLVIFVTAYDQYALRAFDAHALDYLLKPIDDERFERALERAHRRAAERRDGSFGRKLAALLARHGDPPHTGEVATARIAVRDRGKIVLLDVNEIDCAHAEGDYVSLRVGEKSYLVRDTMGAMEARLGGQRFVRIHRSTIVNAARVRELRPRLNNEYIVVLQGGLELKASRGYGERLRALVGTPL